MKKIVLVILGFITTTSVYSKSSLDSLKDYFTIENLTERDAYFKKEYLNKIPWILTEKYFKVKLDPGSRRSYSIDFKENDRFLLFHFAVPCAGGGQCESQYLVTLSLNGAFIDRIEYAHTSADYGFSDIMKSTQFDSFIQQTRVVKDFDVSGGKRQVESVQRTYLLLELLTNGTFKKIDEYFPDSRREFAYSSCRLITPHELDSMTLEQLAVARNEIFACYGYEFKTEKWKLYFKSKPWYQPSEKEVLALLNPIEKENIALIARKEND